MADEKTEEVVKPEALPKTEAELPVAKVAEPQVVVPVHVKKLDPVDELGETIDHFLDGILTLFKKKTDAVIEKLDVPPKNPS